jgi:hypothetical protein
MNARASTVIDTNSIEFRDAPQTYDAITEWCHDLEWERFKEQLPGGTSDLLATVNRSLFASNRIARMLVADARGKRDAMDDDRVTFNSFTVLQVEALELAMVELGARAEECLDSARHIDTTPQR